MTTLTPDDTGILTPEDPSAGDTETASTTPGCASLGPTGLVELAEIGRRLVTLGTALQDPLTPVEKLSELSTACGLHLQVEVLHDHYSVPVEPQ